MNTHIETFSVPKPACVSLKEIAAWDLEHLDAPSPIQASIPALQRGLIWNAQQVELLWDSILRGFPIGCLVASKKVDSQERSGRADITHHLLDGQQRCNAITLGFHDPFDEHSSKVRGNKSESILWLDLAPSGIPSFPHSQLPPTSTREFLARVTTLSHPWGYKVDGNPSNLSASAAREAVEWEYEGKSPLGRKPSSLELLPWASNAPIPLSWLIAAIESQPGEIKDEQTFWRDIKCRLEQEVPKRRWPSLALEALGQADALTKLRGIYRGISRVVHTQLVIMEAPQDILATSRQEKSNQDEEAGIASIEHLFNRLNRQGSPLNGEEFAYSMIKTYWPGIADVIDSVTTCRFPPSHLVSLGIRTALTPPGSSKLAKAIGTSRLRAIATASLSSDEGSASPQREHRIQIERFIERRSALNENENCADSSVQTTRLAQACETVDRWLIFNPESSPNGLLPVLVSSFARGSSDIYLFLLHIADQLGSSDLALDREWNELLPGIATLTHWFAKEDKSAIADVLMECVTEEISPQNIRKGIADAIQKGLIIVPRHPDELRAFIQLPDDQHLHEWRWWESLIDTAPEEERAERQKWRLFLEHTAWQRELLLYAQRSYLHSRFPDYDPSRKDLWENLNRPWDFDHIHASAYFYRAKDGKYAHLCREWGNCIGNLRAWPFEENRSDQKESAKAKLGGKPDQMAASLIESEGELDAFSYGDDSRSVPANARALSEAVKERFIRTYEIWYRSTNLDSILSPLADPSPKPSA